MLTILPIFYHTFAWKQKVLAILIALVALATHNSNMLTISAWSVNAVLLLCKEHIIMCAGKNLLSSCLSIFVQIGCDHVVLVIACRG